MNNQFFAIVTGLLLTTSGIAIAQDHSRHEGAATSQDLKKFDTPEEFQSQLAQVYSASLDLTDAFVNSDADQVKTQARQVEKTLSQVNMKLLQSQSHMVWMKDLNQMSRDLKTMIAQGDLNQQRSALTTFNEALFHSIASLGVDGEKVYYQYCPMANQNQGAYWLSASKEIRNPYFGDKMLNCGATKQTVN